MRTGEDYPTDWQSGLHLKVVNELEEMRLKTRTMEATFQFFVGITLAVVGVIVAAISVKPTEAAFSSLPTFLSLAALILSLIGLLKGTAMSASELKTWWWFIRWILVSLVFGGLCWWLAQQHAWPIR